MTTTQQTNNTPEDTAPVCSPLQLPLYWSDVEKKETTIIYDASHSHIADVDTYEEKSELFAHIAVPAVNAIEAFEGGASSTCLDYKVTVSECTREDKAKQLIVNGNAAVLKALIDLVEYDKEFLMALMRDSYGCSNKEAQKAVDSLSVVHNGNQIVCN